MRPKKIGSEDKRSEDVDLDKKINSRRNLLCI